MKTWGSITKLLGAVNWQRRTTLRLHRTFQGISRALPREESSNINASRPVDLPNVTTRLEYLGQRMDEINRAFKQAIDEADALQAWYEENVGPVEVRPRRPNQGRKAKEASRHAGLASSTFVAASR